MYEISTSRAMINGVKIDVFERCVVEDEAIVAIAAGTNGSKGGERDEGGRTYVRLDVGIGDFLIDPRINDDGEVDGVEIVACGDSGLEAMIKALSFASRTLEELTYGIDE